MSQNIQDALRQAYEALDDSGVSPRIGFMQELSQLVEAPETIPTGDIELSAHVAPGGKYEVVDQHGRRVAGVRSVAVFEDNNGQPVFQVNL